MAKSDFEQWFIRGVGMDSDIPCMLTGTPAEKGEYRYNISGFVSSKEVGERIVAMFGGKDFAKLTTHQGDPSRLQVKVGISSELGKESLNFLGRITKLVKASDNQISEGLINLAKNEFSGLVQYAKEPSARTTYAHFDTLNM